MKKEKAYVDNRRMQIVEIVRKNPSTRVEYLAQLFGVSLITIRRDLQYLEDKKLLTRTHGGATSAESAEDELQMYRRLIAMYAASLVEDGDSLFINTSSNALKMLEYIKCRNVTVITNNGKAIFSEHSQEVSVVLSGGELRHPKDAMVGDFALRNLQPIFAKKTFVGCSGISADAGMTTEIFNEVSVNELMITHATHDVYLLADHTKIGRNSSFISSPIGKINYLITDEKAPGEALDLIREKGVKVYQVRKGEF